MRCDYTKYWMSDGSSGSNYVSSLQNICFATEPVCGVSDKEGAGVDN
jgi:hypothetical protein